MTLIQDDESESNAERRHRRQRIEHWNATARARRLSLGRAYHRQIEKIYRLIVPAGSRVLEFGCGEGDLLAALEPSHGVGVDFSSEMIERASAQHPQLTFLHADVHDLDASETFDFVILSDLVNDLWDVQAVLERTLRYCTPRTRVIINVYSRLWELPLAVAKGLGLARPVLHQNWLTLGDIRNLMRLSGLQPIRQWHEILLPIRIPLLTAFCNRFLVRLWPLNHLGLTNFIVGRPEPVSVSPAEKPVVSVIVPARNEEGNVASIFARVPEMGAGTELILVEGHSRDGTWDAIQREIAAHPQRNVKAFRQTGRGKGDAVRLGFSEASGGILMILDADLTVPPEDLPRFYDVIRSGRGEFVNGVRLVYPMEKEAMRFANLIANKFFGLAFSWLLGQPVKDTLCGTKVLTCEAYARLAANRAYFGDFDPFGDFDLLFGAAKMNLDIVDLPIRYKERTYGSTNIERWKHGWLLLKMCAFAAGRIKFV